MAPEPVPPPPTSPLAPDVEEDLARALAGQAHDETDTFLPPPPIPDGDPILDSGWAGHPEFESRVKFWVEFWTSRGSEHFHRYLERMHRYEEVVDRALDQRDLPSSLRYLPIVESGYNPVAVSRVGATGLWQLMGPTALYLGVTVDRILDERRDPVVSTEAALDYLEQLHRQFGSWFLALAAYNAGQGRVGRALAAHIDADAFDDGTFIELRRNLPAETREFVPRFFAAARIAQDPEGHGFTGIRPLLRFAYEVTTVPDATSLDVVARSAGVPQEAVEVLNPQLLRGFTPAGRETLIRLPEGSGTRFAQAYAELPPAERVSFMEHSVASGETLSHVARSYGVSLADLRAANAGVNPRGLQIGQRLVIPQGATPANSAGSAVVAVAESDGSATGGAGGGEREVNHRVSAGESLWGIARSYDVTLAELRRWNGLGDGAAIHPGDELTVRTSASTVVHRVSRGDTLSGIASRYGVSPRELAQANGIGLTDLIRPGEELTVPSCETTAC